MACPENLFRDNRGYEEPRTRVDRRVSRCYVEYRSGAHGRGRVSRAQARYRSCGIRRGVGNLDDLDSGLDKCLSS